ncbi:MAG: universal stress protein [Desulfobacterales bacterium]|nr:universal stress protein [Desulfobacterales bacterium]
MDEAKRSGRSQAELNKVAARNAEAARGLARRLPGHVDPGRPGGAGGRAGRPSRVSQGLAKDILDYAQNGLFDAILVGRRGISAVQQMFMGSVSAHLVENSPVIPVWLVDGNVRSTRVMAAVDGSESALRAVDHLAFMLSGNPEVQVLFFPRGAPAQGLLRNQFRRGSGRRLGDAHRPGGPALHGRFFPAALAKLREAGFREDQIETRTATTLRQRRRDDPQGRAGGGFGAIVMGRRGMNKSFFGGKVSYTVSQKLSDAALWLVP